MEGVFPLPVGDGQEGRHDEGCDELHVIGVQAQPDDHLVHQVVQNGADGHCQHLQSEVVEHLAEDHLTDDDGRKTDDDSAPAHIYIGETLVLGQQSAGQGHQSVGQHQPQHLGEVGVDALGPGHIVVGTGSPAGAPSSVPKNQYSRPITAATKTATTRMGLSRLRERTLC